MYGSEITELKKAVVLLKPQLADLKKEAVEPKKTYVCRGCKGVFTGLSLLVSARACNIDDTQVEYMWRDNPYGDKW